MPASMKAYSDWCGRVEDLQAWSSPASSSTPPWRLEPAALPCLNTSPERSTPGPLPYHMANTPSAVAPLDRLNWLLAHTAGPPKSSVPPGLEVKRVGHSQA